MIQFEDQVEQDKTNEKTENSTFKTEITIPINQSNKSSDHNENIVILRTKNRLSINKTAYAKLHQLPEFSKCRLSTGSLGIYERKSIENPIITKRNTKSINTINNINNKSIKEESTKQYQNELMIDTNEDEIEDYIPCVIRKSESVDTVDKIEQELSNFVMDNKKKEKKRSNSFRKIFSVSFFSKDKKKKNNNKSVDSTVVQQNSDYTENYQNETNCNSFVRNTPQRHTVSCDHLKNKNNFSTRRNDFPKNIEDPPPEIMQKYANFHINKFNNIRRSFENSDDNSFGDNKNDNMVKSIHPNITKYIDTSSSTNTLESEKQSMYQNAIIAQAELQQVRHNRNLGPYVENNMKLARNNSFKRDTPPRAHDTFNAVNIVKPKARLPINSGRSLPNPYHQDKLEESQVNKNIRPELNEIYGTVLDDISHEKRNTSTCTSSNYSHDSRSRSRQMSPVPRSPRSPSLEMSKLKLAPNREILPSQPRLKSPLPSTRVSTEKLIATELLKNNRPTQANDSKIPIPTKDESDNQKGSVSDFITALRNEMEVNDQNLKQELKEIKSTLQNMTQNDTIDSRSTCSPNSTLNSRTKSSLEIQNDISRITPVQGSYSCSTPEVELRQKTPIGRPLNSSSVSPSSPSKDQIRKSVEAYYWKEIKRIKEQEDYEIYMSQLHFSQGGYAEDPITSRRSRVAQQDGRNRRSSSVPRNVRQHLSFNNPNDVNLVPVAIPEGGSLLYYPNGNSIYGYLPPRNTVLDNRIPKNTSEAFINSSRNDKNYSTYKPIFRRGSLSGSDYQPIQGNKKVSFSNSNQPCNPEAWPTRNGFTKSPPQRRLDRAAESSLEDDVFLPPTNPPNVRYQPIYSDNRRLSLKNNYTSDSESIYGGNQSVYGYVNGPPQFNRNTNYNSDSEAIYGQQRRYQTVSQQDLENLRNAHLKDMRSIENQSKPVPRLTRHESMQLPEPTYGYMAKYGNRRGSYQVAPVPRENYYQPNQYRLQQVPVRRDILISDNIYGQHIGYQNEPQYGYTITNHQTSVDPLYVSRTKQVTVKNKVCDIYGKIHDSNEIQATGVLMGRLQNSPTSPSNFRRGTRLTASSNDIPRRPINYQTYNFEQSINHNVHNEKGNVRPLPPLPPSGRVTTPSADKNQKKEKNSSSMKKKKK